MIKHYREKFDQAVSFSVVRHPFERLVSVFKDKIVRKEKYLYEEFKKQYGNATFAKFVKEVIRGAKLGKYNVHWEPYILSCSYCHFNYSVLSKLETMEEDKKFILDSVGANIPNTRKIQNKVVGDKIEKVTCDSFSELTKEEGEDLANIYKYDLEMFEYDGQKYLNCCKQ